MRAKSLRCAEGKRESMKPVIGIIAACTREVHPAYTTGHDYVRAVERAGGLALLLGIRAALKAPLAAALGAGAGGAVRYGVMVLFAAAVWPMVFAPLCRALEKRVF